MGGLSGHMMHPYDNLSLTKDDLKMMIDESLYGIIPMSEKIDGFNIHVTYLDGQVKFARNKTDLRNGCMTIEDMIRKWHEKPNVLNVYLEGAKLLIPFIENIKDKFTWCDEGFVLTLNCECVAKETNILPYPDNRVYIHNAWEWYADGNHEIIDTNYALSNIDLPQNIYLNQKVIIQDSHNIDAVIRGYCKDLDSMFGECKTIEEYYQYKFIEWCYDNCQWVLEQPHGVKVLFNRFFKNDKSTNLKQIKELYPECAVLIESLCDTEYKYCLEHCTGKFKDFIINVGNTILGNTTGYINEDNKYDICQYLYNQLKLVGINLWNYDHKINALEGVVFNYKGENYKWTGSFTVINKILGNIKYGKLI